jgi:hypothetical protein
MILLFNSCKGLQYPFKYGAGWAPELVWPVLEKRKCLVAGFKPWTADSIAMRCTSYITIPHNEEGANNNCLIR